MKNIKIPVEEIPFSTMVHFGEFALFPNDWAMVLFLYRTRKSSSVLPSVRMSVYDFPPIASEMGVENTEKLTSVPSGFLLRKPIVFFRQCPRTSASDTWRTLQLMLVYGG